jgi:hypothetical protein
MVTREVRHSHFPGTSIESLHDENPLPKVMLPLLVGCQRVLWPSLAEAQGGVMKAIAAMAVPIRNNDSGLQHELSYGNGIILIINSTDMLMAFVRARVDASQRLDGSPGCCSDGYRKKTI